MPIDTTALLKKYNVAPSSKPDLADITKESSRGIITNKQLRDPKQFQIEEDAEFETARKSELDKITSLLDQLEKDYSSEKVGIIKKSRENWDNTPIRGGMSGGISLPAMQNNIPVEDKQYTAARNVLKRAKSTLEALTPTDYRIAKSKGEDLQGFWGNLGQGVSDKPAEDYMPFYNLISGGGSEAQVNTVLEKVSKKQPLSKAEQNILNAKEALQKSQMVNQLGGGVTTGYSVGSGIAESLPFMAELALVSAGTGGIGLAGSIATKALPKIGVMLAQNAVMTPFMSSASKDYNRRTGEQYTINSDENKITVNKDSETSELERLLKAYGNGFANTTSERIFSMIPARMVSKAWNGVAPKLVGAKLASDITKGVSKIATPNVLKWNNYVKKHLNYDGGIEEFGEEMINNVMEPLLTGEPERIADNFSKENLWVTVLSTTLMSSGFHLTTTPIMVNDAIKSSKVSSKAKELFSGIEDADLKQKVFNASKAPTIGEKAVKLSQIDWTGVAPTDAARAFDYVTLSTQKEVLQGAKYTVESQSKLKLARDQYAQLSNPETGNIEVIQSKDGNIYQILYYKPTNPNDAIRYAENLETHQIEQVDVSKTNIVYSTDFNSYMQNIAESLSEKITTNAQSDIENEIREEAEQAGIDPTEAILSARGVDLSNIEGQQVLLDDGRTVYIAGNDGNSYIGKWEDPETMEENDIEVLPEMIMGLRSDTNKQVENPQLLPVDQSVQTNKESPAQSTSIEYPRDKIGNIDYDLITDDQTYINALKEDFSEQETLEIADKYLANIDKKIKSASRIEDPIKQLRKIKDLNIQKAIWNSRKQLMSSTTEVDVPIEEAIIQEDQPVNLDLKGEYLSLEDYIFRDIANGLKFKWADDGVNRGLATELGFKNNNGERKNRISILRNDGTTIDRYTESIMEQLGSDLPDWRIDENDVRSTVIDTILKVFSPKQAREQAIAIRNKYDQSSYEQQYVEEIIEQNKEDDAQFEHYVSSNILPLSADDKIEIFTTFIDGLNTNQNNLSDAQNNNGIYTESGSGETRTATQSDNFRQSQENSNGQQYYDARSNTFSGRPAQEQNQEVNVDPVRDATNEEEKYEAVKFIVDQLNTLSGANAVVFNSIEQLPERVKILFTEQFEQGYQTPAVTFGVKTLLYSPAIIDTLDLKEVYNHEVAAHQNVLRALGNDKESERLLYTKIVEDISTDEMYNVSNTDFRDYINSYQDSNSDRAKFILGKEYVAYLTKDYFTTNDYTSKNIGELSLNLSDVLDLDQVVHLLKVVNQNDRKQRIITILPRDLEQGLYTEMRNSGDDRWRGSHNDASNPSSGIHGDQTINPTGDGLQSSEDRSVPDNQTEISERNARRVDRDQQDASSAKAERNSEQSLTSNDNATSTTIPIKRNQQSANELPFNEASISSESGGDTNAGGSNNTGLGEEGGKRASKQGHNGTTSVRDASTTVGTSSDNNIYQQKSPDESTPSITRDIDATRNVRNDISRETISDRSGEISNQTIDRNVDNGVSSESEQLTDIRRDLPELYKEQQEDVFFAEKRFFTGDNVGKGVLFTNGTGTGKTFTGLGIAKRFVLQGKNNIAIIVPTDTKANDWIEDGLKLNLPIHQLSSTTDAGKDIIITTYANYCANNALQSRRLDLLVYDESHYLGQGKDGEAEAIFAAHKINAQLPSYAKHQVKEDLNNIRPLLQKDPTTQQQTDYNQAYAVWEEKVNEEIKRRVNSVNVCFLSATPFAYHTSLKYADGTLFNIDETLEERQYNGGYNKPSGFGEFLVTNLGYRMRYNKITKPETEVNIDLLERNLNEKLKVDGVLSGRKLEVDKDYSRNFILVNSEIGEEINNGMKLFYNYDDKSFRKRYKTLTEYAPKKWNYLYISQLLESIKAGQVTDRIKQHLSKGRKVVVFYTYNNALPSHPFHFDANELLKGGKFDYEFQKGAVLNKLKAEILDFNREFPQYHNLKIGELENLRALFTKIFGDRVREFNGLTPKGKRNMFKKLFNEANSGVDILLVQRKAGKEGISLHDITGENQRILIDLGLPVAPTDAIQTEGRIYRLGTKSDAVFEYPVIKTDFEINAYASKIAERVRTPENLAMGNTARDLENAFKEGYINATNISPDEIEGTGGKEADMKLATINDFDKAKTYYYGRQKRTSKNKSLEGVDYFATPEPIGYKMAQWLNVKAGDDVLEPSAGHGAIARFFPSDTNNTFIEPSYELATQVSMNAHGEVRQTRFENLYIGNKYDAIAMNPPFGKGGKIAIEHVEKAFKHLKNNGRIVAIIPSGATMNKRFDDFLYGSNEKGKLNNPNAYLTADIQLPSVAFSRAGTTVSCRIVVIDRIDEVVNTHHSTKNIDLSNCQTVEELFDRIEDVTIWQINNSGDDNTRFRGGYINEQFNAELQQQINGKLPKGHIYQLGMPSDALLNAGIPNLPIELNASRLSIKASKDYASDHTFELVKITNLPQAIANPIAVFDSKTQAGSKVILTELTDGINNFVVAVKVNTHSQEYRSNISVNSIRSVYPKDYVQDIINWINRGDLLRWVDKQKALNWLTQQRSNSADVDNPIKGDNTSTNIIKKFTNPTKSSFRDGDFQEITQSEPKNINEAIDQLERKFGVNVIRCENRKALPSNIRFRMSPNARYSGVYNNGQVYMILNEITDADDAIATYLHEVVSHKGIEGLLGKDKTNRLYTTIFDSLDNRIQRELLDRYGDKVIAGDEYCAEIAEGDVTPSVMQRVISAIREFFREVVGLPLRISDNDIRYILWKSAQKLQKAKTLGESMRAITKDQNLRLELFDSVRFRERQEVLSKEFNILDDKDKIVQNAIKVRELLQDDKIRIKLLQDLVLKRGGKVDVTKDLYSSLNRLDSITKTAMDKFERKFMNPLVEYISTLEAFDGSKITYEQVNDYVNAKHSIERHDSGVNALSEEEDGNWTREVTQNIVENFEAELSLDQLNQLWDYVRKATNEILLTNLNAGIMTSETAKELIKRWTYYVPLRGKDFDFENQINLAEYYDYIGGSGYGKTIQNIAGKKANGRISKSEDPLASIQHVGFLTIMYAERNNALMNAVRLIQSNSEMTDLFSLEEIWYRKRPDGTWEETDTVPSAEEVKSSVTAKRNVNDIKKQLQEAKKNNAKSDIIEKLTEQLNDAMDEVTVNKVAYSFGKGYKGTSPSQEIQHYITVMKNGVAQRVRFTDVSIVNAINEINDSVIGKFARSKFGQKVGQGTRFLASISTSKNPAFILANYARDVQHAYLYNLVDSDGNANGYLKYAFTSFKPIHRYLLKQETPLTIAEMAGYDIKNTVDRVELLEKYGHDRVQDTLYDIFISNGGKTGYLHIENAKDYSKKLERQTRRMERHNTPHDWTTIAEFAHGFNVGMDYMAEMSETSTRFAVFLSQLDTGKDILTAVNYSKDITVNFNRKGKWGKGLGVLYLFYNAGVQGSFNAAKLGWKNKGKASLAIGAIAVMGYANSLLLEAMLAGDDDQKWKISDYEKRTNIIIPAFWTENGYMKIPIPILIRPAWNMGLVANDFLNGKVGATEAVKSIFSTSFNSMSPVDVDTESLGKAITPTIAKPILEIKTWNTDFAGRQINRDPFLASQKGYIPDSQLGQPYVHSILKNITTWLNKLGGGNEFVPAGLNWDGSKNYLTEWMDISPSTLEHIMGSYTGGLGKEIMRAINFVTDDEARKQARNLPILNRFYSQAYKQNPSKEYYDIKNMLENTTRILEKSLKAQQPVRGLTLDELAKKVEIKKDNLNELKKVDKQIRSIREALQDLQEGTPEFAEKRTEIEHLQTKFIKYYNDNND